MHHDWKSDTTELEPKSRLVPTAPIILSSANTIPDKTNAHPARSLNDGRMAKAQTFYFPGLVNCFALFVEAAMTTAACAVLTMIGKPRLRTGRLDSVKTNWSQIGDSGLKLRRLTTSLFTASVQQHRYRQHFVILAFEPQQHSIRHKNNAQR